MSASAVGAVSYGQLNDEFLAQNPDIAKVFEEVRSDLTQEECVKVINALRTGANRDTFDVSGPASNVVPMGGRRVCVKVYRWVLMTIYVAWKVNGWGAALGAIPAATVGLAPGVILAAIGIGYSEGAGALKKYIDSHSVWPRQVCAWVD